MDFQEFGTEHEKTLLLLPGTAIPWQINFKNVVDEWAKNTAHAIVGISTIPIFTSSI